MVEYYELDYIMSLEIKGVGNYRKVWVCNFEEKKVIVINKWMIWFILRNDDSLVFGCVFFDEVLFVVFFCKFEEEFVWW